MKDILGFACHLNWCVVKLPVSAIDKFWIKRALQPAILFEDFVDRQVKFTLNIALNVY